MQHIFRFPVSLMLIGLFVTACDESGAAPPADASVDARADAGRGDATSDQGLEDTGARDARSASDATDVALDVDLHDTQVSDAADAGTDTAANEAGSRDASTDTLDSGLTDASTTDAAQCDGGACGSSTQFESFGGPAAPMNARSWGYRVSVSRDGRTLLVADPRRSTRVFARTDTTPFWRETFVVTPAMTNANLGYEAAISADGNTFAVTSYETNFGWSGPVFVFARSGDTWSEQGRLAIVPQDPEEGTYFGTSLAISADGNTVVVGADQGDYLGALVFSRNGTTWDAGVRLTAPAGQPDEYVKFGIGVAIAGDGNTVAVGCAFPDREPEVSIVTIHSRAQGMWSQTATINAPPLSNAFGVELAISTDGSVLVVGDEYGDGSGQVSVSYRDGANWSAPVTLPRPSGSDAFGSTVAVSSNGRTIVVGDPTSGENNSGQVAVFQRNGSTWNAGILLRSTLPSIDLATFGTDVAISGDGQTILVGDRNVDPNGFVSAFRAL